MRAMASAYIWAEKNQFELKILWSSSDVLNCPPRMLFHSDFVNSYFLDASNVYEDFLNRRSEEFYFDAKEKALFVAGGHSGEQAHLANIQKHIKEGNEEKAIVLKAGGLFHECFSPKCPDCSNFQLMRSIVYEKMGVSNQVKNEISQIQAALKSSYLAIHVRTTDFSRDKRVSLKRLERELLKTVSRFSDTNQIYICGDSPEEIIELGLRLEERGLEVIKRHQIDFRRQSESNTRSALTDFWILSSAKAIVFSNHSSFAYEAAVLGGTVKDSRGLNAHFPKLIKFIDRNQHRIARLISK